MPYHIVEVPFQRLHNIVDKFQDSQLILQEDITANA